MGEPREHHMLAAHECSRCGHTDPPQHHPDTAMVMVLIQPPNRSDIEFEVELWTRSGVGGEVFIDLLRQVADGFEKGNAIQVGWGDGDPRKPPPER